MTPFYSTPERKAALSTQARLWIGTPFRAGSAVLGRFGGVDCVGLAHEIHVATGACKPHAIERNILDWHLHHVESPIIAFFRQEEVRGRLRHVHREDPPMHGDIVVIRVGANEGYHVGTFLDDQLGRHLLHVPIGLTVQRWSIGVPPLAGHIASIWRILE
jgi:hypothetical protein